MRFREPSLAENFDMRDVIILNVTPENPFTFFKNPDGTYAFRCPKCGQIIQGLSSMAAMIYRGFGHRDKCLVAATSVSQHGPDGPSS
jgi:hypothetical protein